MTLRYNQLTMYTQLHVHGLWNNEVCSGYILLLFAISLNLFLTAWWWVNESIYHLSFYQDFMLHVWRFVWYLTKIHHMFWMRWSRQVIITCSMLACPTCSDVHKVMRSEMKVAGGRRYTVIMYCNNLSSDTDESRIWSRQHWWTLSQLIRSGLFS